MNIKLIAFDLDGTLLDDSKRIPKENLAALKEAAGRGILIVPATGRLYDGIPEEIRALPYIRYYLCINGAYVYDSLEKKVLHTADIPLETALRFYRYEDTRPAIYDCYQGGWGYMSREMFESCEAYIPDPGLMRLIRLLRTPVDDLKSFLEGRGGSIQKLQAFFRDPDERAYQFRVLPEMFPELSFTFSYPFNIEVNSAAATKGQALEKLCGLLGIGLADTMALGDGGNDADMLKKAGLGTAMGNAGDELKAIADAVTGDNNSAGFAQAIKRYVLK